MDRVKKAGKGVPTGLSVHFYNSSHTPKLDKGKGLDTCYSATYMSQTGDKQRFTISEVAADWHNNNNNNNTAFV